MGWDVCDGRAYYSRSRKVNGRIVREYIGKGPLAEAMAAADTLKQAQRQAQAQALRQERARQETAQAPLKRFAQGTDLLVRSFLVAAGYHQHDRGQWRKRHGSR